MRRMIAALRLLMLAAGVCGMALSAWALVDPAAFPAMAGGRVEPPSPRWRAAFAFVFSCAVAGMGAGALRRRRPR